MPVDQIAAVVQALRSSFRAGRTRSFDWRQRQLDALQRCVEDHKDDFIAALVEDLGKPPLEAFAAEVAFTVGELEAAKRRVLFALQIMALPLVPRDEDPDRGLAFDFLETLPGEPAVLTGHAGGVVTLNIAEADDDYREQSRESLKEPYRTVIGHLRHELGHFASVIGRRLEIRAHPAAQIDRLADVDHRAVGRLHQVTAGFRRKAVEEQGKTFGHGHGK